MRYDENPDLYFDWDDFKKSNVEESKFDIESIDLKNLEVIIQKNGLETTAKDLLQFLESAIQLREYSKFEFSKNLSDSLKYIRELGLN